MTNPAPPSQARPGVFITFEGGDGTGKSTQLRLLCDALAARGVDVVKTREPGGTPQAERIRDLLLQRDSGSFDPLSEALLLFAARREHLVNVIEPSLQGGKWVISDRFVDSTRAFQGYGMGLDKGAIETLYKMVAGDRVPDLTFIFDIDPQLGLERSGRKKAAADTAAEATEDRYERMGLAFHTRLREGFLATAKAEPHRCVVIDATQSIEAVAAAVLAEVERRFGPLAPVRKASA